MNHRPMPKYLYRYLTFDPLLEDRTSNIFLHNKHRYSNPIDFRRVAQDFEVGETIPTEMEEKVNPVLTDYIKDGALIKLAEAFSGGFINNIRVLCFCEKADDIRMWAHYAASHKGYCLKFDSYLLKKDTERLMDVQYAERYPQLPISETEDEAFLETLLFTKSNDWKYELEWRDIRHVDKLDSHGHHIINPESLVGVIFGCEMKAKDRGKILRWIKRGPTKPSLYQARMKSMEFGLKISPFE